MVVHSWLWCASRLADSIIHGEVEEFVVLVGREVEVGDLEVVGTLEEEGEVLELENAGEDPEIRVSVKENGELGIKLMEVMLKKGKVVVLEKVRVWVESMAKGGPVKDELEAKKVAVPHKNNNNNSSNGDNNVKKEEVKKNEGKKGFKVISLIEKFNCRARDLFEILMDENRWRGFTQSNARISKEVGGEFSIFDGSVTGKNLELDEGKLIVQGWRFGSWPDGIESMVRIVFEEPEDGVTVVKLTHSDVPEEDRYGNATVVENTERGWRDLIFQRIRTAFGFGI
ncbi:Activator of 90 kDa heat shock protein ATPase like [Glycine soja]|uniref:Activator of 90 kDa heat shock protein ATPase like n=1 Tax=Glycine soja TaxID=3848 RepID=A0A0B2SAF0_GLYSO|nr:Activator of 90 kDa heat shock protein ATPase like [Glycine soja]